MTYGGNQGVYELIGNVQQDAVNEQVKFAVDAGINFIDTANVYAPVPDGQLAASIGCADRTCLASCEAIRDERDHRRKIHASVARQGGFDPSAARRCGDEAAG